MRNKSSVGVTVYTVSEKRNIKNKINHIKDVSYIHKGRIALDVICSKNHDRRNRWTKRTA